MTDEKKIEELVRQALAGIGNGKSAPKEQRPEGKLGLKADRDYPLGKNRPDIVKTGTGLDLDDITMKDVMSGNVKAEDLRITAKALLAQAEIADDVGRLQLAQNFRRAAELTKVPDERVLEIYTALRPHRSSKDDLLEIARELEETFDAPLNANHLKEAAEVYERRGLLRESE